MRELFLPPLPVRMEDSREEAWAFSLCPTAWNRSRSTQTPRRSMNTLPLTRAWQGREVAMHSRLEHCFCRARALLRRLRKQTDLCWCDRCRRISDKNDALYWQTLRDAPQTPTVQDATRLLSRLERLLRRSHQLDALMDARHGHKETRPHVGFGRKIVLRLTAHTYNAAIAIAAAASSCIGALHSPHLPAKTGAEITTDLDVVSSSSHNASPETGSILVVDDPAVPGAAQRAALRDYLLGATAPPWTTTTLDNTTDLVGAVLGTENRKTKGGKVKIPIFQRIGPGTPANRRGLSSQAKRRGTARARKRSRQGK